MARTSFSGDTGTIIAVLLLIACSACAVSPVSAATQYIGGSPSFSANVDGTNEFAPGQDAIITILVKNTGLNAMKQLDRGTIEAEDLPTTAKFVTIGLSSDNDAILVKTDPQMFGNIPAGGTGVPVRIHLKIASNATEGEYRLPLSISYKYLKVIPQEQADVYEYTYNTADKTVPVTIHIKPEVKIEIVESVTDPLSPGSEGYVALKIRNAGLENGTMAVAKLVRSGTSSIIPTDGTIFIGDLPSGRTAGFRSRVSVSNDAINQTYPVTVIISYTNREGSVVTSKPETIGIPVKDKTAFSIVSAVPEVADGSTGMIEIRYRNDGTTTAYAVQSRISTHDPVTIDDNMAYLGDIQPGQSASALFKAGVTGGSDPGAYTFDSTLRYRDGLGNSLESDTVPVQITVVPAAPGISAVAGGTLAIAGCVMAGIGIALLAYRQKNKSR
ncbi:MAG TPA: S-layer protein [Methanoregula sp.]|nr:S-layer protein [Methanoregula sp.]